MLTNARALAEVMGELATKQLPFASAVTLTRLAQLSAAKQRGYMQQQFDIRAPRVLRGITIESAKKRDWPNLAAKVGTLDEFIASHEEGGRKRPKRGAKRIAVPVRQVIKKGAGGKIATSRRPRALVKAGKVRELEGVLRGQKGKRKGAPMRAFYWLKPFVVLKPRLRFHSNASKVVGERYDEVFALEWEAALRSARAKAGKFTSSEGRYFYRLKRGLVP